MATTRGSRKTRSPSAPTRFRWTTAQYHRLADLGVFRNRRVELIGGEIFEMAPVNPPHAIAVELADTLLRAVFGPGHRIRVQQPMDLGRRSQPEPDLVVLSGSPRDDPSQHPSQALLVLEVSDSSLSYDRSVKTHLYARANLPDHWLLNLIDRQLEIRRQPTPDPDRQGRWTYQSVTIIPTTGHASPLGRPDSPLSVADLLP